MAWFSVFQWFNCSCMFLTSWSLQLRGHLDLLIASKSTLILILVANTSTWGTSLWRSVVNRVAKWVDKRMGGWVSSCDEKPCMWLYIPLDNWSLLSPASQILQREWLVRLEVTPVISNQLLSYINGSFVYTYPQTVGALTWEQCMHAEFASLHYRGEFFAPIECKGDRGKMMHCNYSQSFLGLQCTGSQRMTTCKHEQVTAVIQDQQWTEEDCLVANLIIRHHMQHFYSYWSSIS